MLRRALPPALKLFRHPFRLLVTGRAKSGKTTVVVNLINSLWPLEDWEEFYILCPTFGQKTYKGLDGKVKITKHIDSLDEEELAGLLEKQKEMVDKKKKAKRVLILIDDCSSQVALNRHGRKGIMADLGNNARHHNISVIVITQNITAVTPAMRENADAFMMFQTLNKNELENLTKERNTEQGDEAAMARIYFDAVKQPYDFFLQLNLEGEGMVNWRNYDIRLPSIRETEGE